MDAATFGKLISELSLYFERKPPTQATFQQWLQEMAGVPNTALYNLMGAVKECEAWPRNLPNFLKGKHFQVQESDNPNKYAIPRLARSPKGGVRLRQTHSCALRST